MAANANRYNMHQNIYTCKFMNKMFNFMKCTHARTHSHSHAHQKWEPQNCWISITQHLNLALKRRNKNERIRRKKARKKIFIIKIEWKRNRNCFRTVCVCFLCFFPIFISSTFFRFYFFFLSPIFFEFGFALRCSIVICLPSNSIHTHAHTDETKRWIAWNEKQRKNVLLIWNWEYFCAHISSLKKKEENWACVRNARVAL